jgi:hypothetical protein
VASFTQSAYEPIAPGIFQTAKEFSEPRPGKSGEDERKKAGCTNNRQQSLSGSTHSEERGQKVLRRFKENKIRIKN